MRRGWLWFALFVLTGVVANWAVNTFGVVPVGFGLQAPAAVFVVGFAFTFRDLVQESLGITAVVLAIALGAAVSAFINPALAFASGVAFLFSELLDLTAYTPLREWDWIGAVFVSNVIGIAVDSFVFLALATPLGPDRMDYVPGQMLGKGLVMLATVAVLAAFRNRREVLIGA